METVVKEQRYRITLLYKFKMNCPPEEGTLKELKKFYRYFKFQKIIYPSDLQYIVVDKYDDVIGYLKAVVG